jgi:hypothetical protein
MPKNEINKNLRYKNNKAFQEMRNALLESYFVYKRKTLKEADSFDPKRSVAGRPSSKRETEEQRRNRESESLQFISQRYLNDIQDKSNEIKEIFRSQKFLSSNPLEQQKSLEKIEDFFDLLIGYYRKPPSSNENFIESIKSFIIEINDFENFDSFNQYVETGAKDNPKLLGLLSSASKIGHYLELFSGRRETQRELEKTKIVQGPIEKISGEFIPTEITDVLNRLEQEIMNNGNVAQNFKDFARNEVLEITRQINNPQQQVDKIQQMIGWILGDIQNYSALTVAPTRVGHFGKGALTPRRITENYKKILGIKKLSLKESYNKEY